MREVTRVAERRGSSWRASLLTFAGAVLLAACATGTPDDAAADLHGLDPARVSESSLTAHCVREIRKPRNRRAEVDSPEVTRCVKRHEAMVIDVLLKRQETTQFRPDPGHDTTTDQLSAPSMLAGFGAPSRGRISSASQMRDARGCCGFIEQAILGS